MNSPYANPAYQEKSDQLRAELRQHRELRFLELPVELQSKIRQLIQMADKAKMSGLCLEGLEIGAVQLAKAVSRNDFADLMEATISTTYFLIDWAEAEQNEV